MNNPRISDEFQALMMTGHKARFFKKQIIQSTDDRRVFNYIVSGYVKRFLITNEGDLAIQVVYGPEDLFPITLALSVAFDQPSSKSPETFYYETMTEVELYTMNDIELRQYLDKNPMLYKELLGVASKRLHTVLHSLENVSLKDSYHRVAHELFYMAEKFGNDDEKGRMILVPLTHQDLADVLCLSRETVSITLSRLRKNGLVSPARHIIVNDVERLKAEAYS